MFIHFLSIDSSLTPDPYADLVALFPTTIGELAPFNYKVVIGKAPDGPSFDSFASISDDRSILVAASNKADQSGFEVSINKLIGGRYIRVQTITPAEGSAGNFGTQVSLVANDTMLLIGQGSSWLDNKPATVHLYQKNAQGLFDFHSTLSGETNGNGNDITGLDNFAFSADATKIASCFFDTSGTDYICKVTIWSRTGATWSASTSTLIEATRQSEGNFSSSSLAISGDGNKLFFKPEYSTGTVTPVYCFNIQANNNLEDAGQYTFPEGAAMSFGMGANYDGSDLVVARHVTSAPTDASDIYFVHYHASGGDVTENHVTVPNIGMNTMFGYMLKVSQDGQHVFLPGSIPVEGESNRGAVHHFKKQGSTFVLNNSFVEPNVGTGLMGEYFTETIAISYQGNAAVATNGSWTTSSDETLGLAFVIEL